MPRKLPVAFGSLALVMLLGACTKAPDATPQAAPIKVAVETVEARPLFMTSELSGRIAAPRVAEVRARVPGVVLRQVFDEGSEVRRGDVLFQIDPAPLQADLDSALAGLQRAQADASRSSVQEQRYRRLISSNAVSAQEYDNIRATARQASADVAAQQSAVQRARLNLGYATVTAPISGRIGRALVTEGALVGQDESTPLAVIQQLDPIYANLTQSTRQLNDLRQAFRAGNLEPVGHEQAMATLIQDDGRVYPLPGRLLFSELSVDPGTSQIILRSEFPNPDLDLLPGSFVRVRLQQAINPRGISVPQRAVIRDSAGISMVLRVDAHNIVSQQPVELGAVIDDRWVVSQGLEHGDRIIVEGLQHARPGSLVQIDNPTLPIAQTSSQ